MKDAAGPAEAGTRQQGVLSASFLGTRRSRCLGRSCAPLPAPRGPCPKPGSFDFTTPSGEITRCSFLHCVPFGLSDDFLRLFFFLIVSLDFYFFFLFNNAKQNPVTRALQEAARFRGTKLN